MVHDDLFHPPLSHRAYRDFKLLEEMFVLILFNKINKEILINGVIFGKMILSLNKKAYIGNDWIPTCSSTPFMDLEFCMSIKTQIFLFVASD
jgi:hypothetical protein